MKIECPSCHLTGKVNELELPPLGREMICPRCKKNFHVAKPPAATGTHMMNSCPSCQYSTFSEEMFAVCPKCGLTAENAQAIFRKQREREQDARNQQALNRSYRNPDLITLPTEKVSAEPAGTARPVEVAARLCMALGGAVLCYGLAGLVKYYSKDWQAILSEPVLEPVSKLHVFFSLGLQPWLMTLVSLHFIWAAARFSRLQSGSLLRMTEAAYAAIAVVVLYEATACYDWAKMASSTPTISFYGVGVLSSLFMTALLGAPFFVLLRFLRSAAVMREYRKAQVLTDNG
jgi:predicted Zn finger-like uncharacterized protein